MHPPDSRHESAGRWVSFDQARMQLRLSEGTLRRAIKAGTVRAELRRRNPASPTDQRMVYEVWLPDAPSAAPTAQESAPATAAATEPGAAISGLLELLAADRALIAEQADRIAALEREAGELSGSVDSYRRETEWLRAELTRARRPWWRRLLGS